MDECEQWGLCYNLSRHKQIIMRVLTPAKKKKPSPLRRFMKLAKQLFAQHSHLAKYLPLMTETKQSRICRLVNDCCLPLANPELPLQASLTRWLFPRLRVFAPTEPIMLIWYWFVFAAILYYYVEMGLVLTYGLQVWQDELSNPVIIAMDILTILVLGADILVGFNCGYLYRGMVVMDQARVTTHYVRYFLVIDVVSLGVVVLCPASGWYWLNYAKLWLILKVGRLFQIDDFYLRKLNIHRKSKAVYVIFKLMVIIFLLSHLVGLVFYAMDYNLCASGRYEQQFCWLYNSTAYSPIIELSYSLQYLYTLYWGINTITTISYGDIAAMNPVEVNYTIVCFCFGFMVYGYVVNQIVKIILWAREHEDEFRAQLILMDTYMQKMDISRELRKDIHDYLYFVHKEEKNRDLEMEAKMIQKIPEELRIELLKNAYEYFYAKMLSIFYTPDIIRIFFYLSEKKFTHNEPIFNQGSRASALYFLSKGKANFVVKHGMTNTRIYETQAFNEMIGHYEVFMRERWTYSAVTTTSSLIYFIDRDKLMDEINSRVKLRERYKLVQSRLMFQNKCREIFHCCFFCNQEHHYIQCPDKFAIFALDPRSIADEDEHQHTRQPRYKQNSLALKKEMAVFRALQTKDNYRLIIKVERRLAKIKRIMEKKNREFEIDVAHDWQFYYTGDNFSKIRERWNGVHAKSKK